MGALENLRRLIAPHPKNLRQPLNKMLNVANHYYSHQKKRRKSKTTI
jgi:hypothetical protein